MWKFIVGLTVLVLVKAAQQNSAQILRYNVENYKEQNGLGNYKFSFETSDGISRDEKGAFEPETNKKSVSGFYSYTGTDGNKYKTTYVADENGYRPNFIIEKNEPEISIQTISLEKDSDRVLSFPAAALASLAGGGLGK